MEIPDLNDVRTFVLIAQAGTLTAAAKDLALPTSTVSRSLTRLERELDVILMQRGPRGLALTDIGKEYLQTCRRALRTLKDGAELLEGRRKRPSGLIKIACPVTMARNIFAPLLKEFLERYPELRVEIEPYATGWDPAFPGTVRGLFASPKYASAFGTPATPDELTLHTCIGSGIWKLSRSSKLVAPNISFKVIASDPLVHLKLAVSGLGIAILPLYMAKRPGTREQLIPVLPSWIPEPIIVCALFSGPARMTPKVKVLLDFLSKYIGTDRDPRLHGMATKGLFTKPELAATSGP